MNAVCLFLFFALLASCYSADLGFKRLQSISFVIDNKGNSTADGAEEVAMCVQHFVDRIMAGKVRLGAAVATDGEDAVAQSHQLAMHTVEQGIGCTLVWTLSSKISSPDDGMRSKRSPALEAVLGPILEGAREGLGALGRRRRRSVSEESLRMRRSPLLGGLLDKIFGSGGGEEEPAEESE